MITSHRRRYDVILAPNAPGINYANNYVKQLAHSLGEAEMKHHKCLDSHIHVREIIHCPKFLKERLIFFCIDDTATLQRVPIFSHLLSINKDIELPTILPMF